MLRDWLWEEHGLRLPIGGGLGRHADDPVVLATDSLHWAIETQDQIAACLFAGQQWRLLGKQTVPERPQTECCVYELRFVDQERPVAEPRHLYFDRQQLDWPSGQTTPACGVPLPTPWGFGWPAQFGWWHFEKLEQPAPNELVLTYRAKATQVRVRLFAEQRQDWTATRLASDMEQALAALQEQHPQLQRVNENQTAQMRWASFDIGQRFSALALTHCRGHGCQIHMTLDESAIGQDFQCLMDSLGQMVGHLHPPSGTNPT